MLFRLSKSKLLSGIQCQKRLYLEVHQANLAEQGNAMARLLANGNLVGEIARRAYSKGRLIEHTADPAAALTQTASILEGSGNMTLFEPAFQYGGALVRADIFRRIGGKHNLIEVKSSTAVKDYHLNDAAIQYWVINGAGYSLKSVSIAVIDTTFVYQGNGDYGGLLKQMDVTDQLLELQQQVPLWIKEFRKMLAGKMPRVAVGAQCTEPFACPFMDYCHRNQPEYPVEILPRAPKLAAALRADGYKDLREVPASRIEGTKHKLIWRVTKKGKPEIDPRVRQLTRDYAYPRFYLDFETVSFAVPIWKGTRPYQSLPFQWSCHVERDGGVIEHRAFIDTSGEPPMRAFAESLIKALGKSGPILVYSPFEKGEITKLAIRFPDLASPLNKLVVRIKDLLLVTQNNYYHPAMKGSWGLKAVLPTIAPDLNYSGEVQDGNDAMDAYLQIIDATTTPERREQLKQELLEYCKLDTLALVRLVRFFAGVRVDVAE